MLVQQGDRVISVTPEQAREMGITPDVAAGHADHDRRREEVIAAAIIDGKILPESAHQYRERFNRDPEGTTRVLAALHPVLASGQSVPAPTNQRAYPASMISPAQRARLNGQRPGGHIWTEND